MAGVPASQCDNIHETIEVPESPEQIQKQADFDKLLNNAITIMNYGREAISRSLETAICHLEISKYALQTAINSTKSVSNLDSAYVTKARAGIARSTVTSALD